MWTRLYRHETCRIFAQQGGRSLNDLPSQFLNLCGILDKVLQTVIENVIPFSHLM